MTTNENDTPNTPSTSESTETKGGGTLILPEQALPPNLFVLPVQNIVAFPTLMAPIVVNHPRFVATVEEAISRERTIGLLLAREGDVREDLRSTDLYQFGVVVKILKRLKLPDGGVNLLVHSVKRFRVKRFLSEQPHMVVETEYLDDTLERSTEMDALSRTVVAHVKKLSEVNPFFTEEMRMAMINAPGPGTVADLVAFSLSLPRASAQEFLETIDVKERFQKLLVHLKHEQDVAEVQRKINDSVNTKLQKLQREFFLKEQLKMIKRELGVEEDGKEQTSRTLRERIEAAGMPEDVKKIALEEVSKFETITESSPEHNLVRNYLETLVSLPWSKETEDRVDLKFARKVLDEEHFGLEKVKERILEFLAVKKLKNDRKGSILLLVGPPGVGKTSLGKSIAKTLGRSFHRFSLGGMRDEAEIKGHRRTYIGAMPGKVINAMKRAGTKNPVILLDEIDKLGASFQGDPASALLEVLDPEQNASFTDHYLDVPFDLSNVLFIATANNASTIPGPLYDRMELIELPGYTLEEKEDIARRYVIPKEAEAHGVRASSVKIDKAALAKIMTDYSREPGLRTLTQLIGRVFRKAAAQIVAEGESRIKRPRELRVTTENLQEWLGPQRFFNDSAERISAPGVVIGLAWTSNGGDILFIEATDIAGTGQLKTTGQMGSVMNESAAIAWSYVKRTLSKSKRLEASYFKEWDFHLHIPAGAIPKDGPSAGITMAAALYGLMTGQTSRKQLAMTGELSLIGKVLPVGGIKEKLLAAKRSGVIEVILPEQNRKDLSEVPPYALDGMKIHFVKHVDEVFELVFGAPKAAAKVVSKRAKRVLRTRARPTKITKRKPKTLKSSRSALN